MIPFPGESIGIGDAYSSGVDGWDIWYNITLRDKYPFTTGAYAAAVGHQEIVAGEDWWAWAYSYDRPYLEAADDAMPLEVKWVVEVLGGTGTLVVSDFFDADWDYVTTAPLANALGTIDVAGPGTYTIATTSFTNAQLRQAGYELGPAQVCIECTSGAVDVAQVKLRVWPITGPLGYWSEDPVTQDPQDVYPTMWTQEAVPSSTPGPRGWWESQALMRGSFTFSTASALASTSGMGVSGSWFENSLHAYRYIDNLGNEERYSIGSFNYAYYRVAEGSVIPDGVSWMRPPEEVQDENYDVLFQLTGAPILSWAQGIVSGLHHAQGHPGGGYAFAYGHWHASLEEVDSHLATGSPTLPLIGAGAEIEEFPDHGHPDLVQHHNEGILLPAPQPHQLYRLTVWHDGLVAEVDETITYFPYPQFGGGLSTWGAYRGLMVGDGTGEYGVDYTVTPLRAEWDPGPYRYWDPAAVAPEPVEPPSYPPGYFLRGTPNLDGLDDGVVVNFN